MKNLGNIQLASRYVGALFEVAKAARALETVEADLQKLAALVGSSAAFSALIHNPLMGTKERANAIGAMLDKAGVNKITKDFMLVLAAAKRLSILPDVAELFARKAQEVRGEISAELVSAYAVSKEESALVAERLSKACGKKILLSTSHNEALLGGVIVRIGSKQLDASLAGKLQRLKNILKVA